MEEKLEKTLKGILRTFRAKEEYLDSIISFIDQNFIGKEAIEREIVDMMDSYIYAEELDVCNKLLELIKISKEV